MAIQIQKKILLPNDWIVVVFDICSSTNIIEDLTERHDIKRFKTFLTTIKQYLRNSSTTVEFKRYKFIGDGWILLFPLNTDGKVLLTFLRDLCIFFKKELSKQVVPYLDNPPKITGLTFGVEKGQLGGMTMDNRGEFIGRPLNIACRLQGAVSQRRGSPAYRALVSNTVFDNYFAPATGYIFAKVCRCLKNIHGGNSFECTEIELLAD